jgi:hypothetical protein
MNIVNGLSLQANVNPSVWHFWRISRLQEVRVCDAPCLKVSVGSLHFLLEFKALKAFVSISTSLGSLFRTNVEVEHEVGLNQTTISA